MVFAHSLNKLHLRGHWINRCNLWSSCKSGGRILHFIIATNVHRTIIREILLRIQTTEGDKRQTELTPTLELMAPVIVTHLGRGKWRLCSVQARKGRNFWDVSCDPLEMCQIRHQNCHFCHRSKSMCHHCKHGWEPFWKLGTEELFYKWAGGLTSL